MSKPPRPSARPESVAAQFQREIEAAEGQGVARSDMTLNLTFGDANKLKRDRDLALTAISFSDGTMRFLGVRVVEGGVAESLLSRPEES
jgi:hypothetical protein